MDDRRLDDLARALAGPARRRGVLRLLAGGVAAGWLASRGRRGATAHHGNLGPGDPCRDDSQCGNQFPELGILYCADNGFDYDGPLNCCRYEGGTCGGPLSDFDEACCGDLRCVGGACTRVTTYSGPGEPCQASGQCLAADTALSCDYVASTDDYRCCAYEGGGCGTDAGCCGSLTCYQSTCMSGSPSAPAVVPGCTGEGCACSQGQDEPDPCDPGLVCCLETDTSGTCKTLYQCTGGGLPGEVCARYCLPGPTQCPGCISGYCTAAGTCG